MKNGKMPSSVNSGPLVNASADETRLSEEAKMEPEEMRNIMAEFKTKHPNVEGLNIQQMKKVLAGELIMVKHAGRRKFTLMTPAEVAPGGKLDQHNAEVRRINAEIRRTNRERQHRFQGVFESMWDAALHGTAGDVERIFDAAIKK